MSRVAIVGGGAIGLCVGISLRRRALDVTIIDMSDVEGGDALHHSVVAASPVMISLVQGLGRYGPAILDQEKANIGLAATTASVYAGVLASPATRRYVTFCRSPSVAAESPGKSAGGSVH